MTRYKLFKGYWTKCGGEGGTPGPCPENKPGAARATQTTKKGEELHPVTRGQDGKYYLADGRLAPEHVQKLGIPPAWKDVYINPNPNGDLLASGKDAKGRTQPRYSDSHDSQAQAVKFARTRGLIKKRKEIYKELEKDAKDPALRDRAQALKVVMQTGMRPGSDNDTGAEYPSFGATTLKGSHVKVGEDGSVSLRLVTGKNKGREVTFPIHDSATAAMLKERAGKVGGDGRLFDVSASQLRSYSKDKDGKGFKTKDHRTALGTEVAVRAIQDAEPPTNKKEYKERTKEVATRVASTLGNTPLVALKAYIDPTVWAGWRQGAGV